MRIILALVALLLATPAMAQTGGRGLFVRPSCATITSPVTGQTWCFDSTARVLRVWNGSTYETGTASGITSLNGLTPSAQLFANDTNVTITSGTATHTLGWTGSLSVPRGGTGVAGIIGLVVGNNTLPMSPYSGTFCGAQYIYQLDASGNASCRLVSLTAGVSGTLPIGQGGTNATGIGVAGTVPYSSGTAYAFSALGSAGDCFKSGGSSAPTWGACASAGGGTVTSVASGTGLTGGPITTSGTLSLVIPVVVSSGGTGATTLTGLVLGNGTSAMTAYGGTSCTNQFLTALGSTGVGTCTTDTLAGAYHANQGTTTTLLHGNAAGNPSWAAVSLTADVSGLLPGANGGAATNLGTGYAQGSLPAAGTAGRIARVTDVSRGLWMDQGSQWFSITGNVINVKEFGATGDGSTDDTSAINAAIAALPTYGGEVYFPPGNYKISTTLTIGDGTTSAASTRYGVTLRGGGQPILPTLIFSGYQTTPAVKLTWAGSGSPMIFFKGPMQGWSVKNLYLECAGNATIGLSLQSVQFGDVNNLAINNCTSAGMQVSAITVSGVASDSSQNVFNNIAVAVSTTTNAKGVLLTGNATNDTHSLQFNRLFLAIPGTGTVYGLYLGATESNQFIGVHIAGGSASATAVLFDYSVNTAWPASNVFLGLETGGGSMVQAANTGTPGAGARPNFIAFMNETNSAVVPVLANLYPMLPVVPKSVAITGRTTQISGTSLLVPWAAGMYRISWYLTTTAGTGCSGGTIQPGFTFTAQGTSQTINGGTVACIVNGTFTQGNITIFSDAGQTINYQAAFNSVSGTVEYAYYITLERLGT